MNKTSIFTVIILLIVAGGVYYLSNRPVSNDALVNNDNSEQNQVDISSWVDYQNEAVGYSFEYFDGMELIIDNDIPQVNLLTLREKQGDTTEHIISFRSHTPESEVQRGLGFQDFHRFEINDGNYYLSYGTDQEIQVEVIEILSTYIGEVVVVDTKSLQETMPVLGISSDYAAIVNLEDAGNYYGISILPNDEKVDYNTFIQILKTMNHI